MGAQLDNEELKAHKFNAFCVAVDMGLFASEVLLTLAKLTIVGVMPVTVPVKAGDANGANRFNAFCVAIDMGLFASEVLLTFGRLTIAAVMPVTVPVKAGDANGANGLKAALVI